VPHRALYGIFTQRARETFDLSGMRTHPEHIRALGLIKKASARVNRRLGLLSPRLARAIEWAADRVIAGDVADAFVLDAFQAGAGTPSHMNVNEVIANLANERLGGRRGAYTPVHPNDHVNIGQSSNDVTPTAIRLMALALSGPLERELLAVQRTFRALAAANRGVVKPGRTHLQDAVPITYGQVFEGYAQSVVGAAAALTAALEAVREIGLGGTAVGTGITAHPRFGALVARELSRVSGFRLRPAPSTVTTTWSLRPLLGVSAALRGIAVDGIKICADLRLLASGPHTGLGELSLPEIEPGSSIMPGKVNPSVPEAVQMALIQIMGNDAAICSAAQAGELELNVMTPLLAFDLAWSFELCTRAWHLLRVRCLEGLRVNRDRVGALVEHSLLSATALSPYLGYPLTARLVKEALATGQSLHKIVEARNLIPTDALRRLLAPDAVTGPRRLDVGLKRRIQASPEYRRTITER
jgi:aspartate ammonia-lyase